VKPDTLIRWHRKGFQLFWRWKSRSRGRPRVPADLQRLIGEMNIRAINSSFMTGTASIPHVSTRRCRYGLTVLKTPVRAPQANAFCERLIGIIRRECLDFVILFNERHARTVLGQWVAHYGGTTSATLDRPSGSSGPVRRTRPDVVGPVGNADQRDRSGCERVAAVAALIRRPALARLEAASEGVVPGTSDRLRIQGRILVAYGVS